MLSLSKYEGLWSVSPFMRSLVLYQPAVSETHCGLASATARPSQCEESLRGD